MSNINYGRVYQLIVYTPTVEAETQKPLVPVDKSSSTIQPPTYFDKYVIDDLDFSSEITYNVSEVNNNDKATNITIKGLPNDNTIIKVGAYVEVRAGYSSHGEVELPTLFSGTVTDFSFSTSQGSSVALVCAGNATVSKVARLAVTFPTGTSIRLVADTISPLLSAPITLPPVLASTLLKEPLYLYGNALDEFGDFLNDLKYSITYNVSGYYVDSTSSKAESYDLYEVFEPDISQVLSGLARASNNSQTVAKDGSTSGNLKLTLLLKYIPPLSVISLGEVFGDFQGSYIPQTITYRLDTRNSNWYTVLELKERPDIQL